MLTIREILVNPKYQVSCRKDICRVELNDESQITTYCDDDTLELQIAEIGTASFDSKDRNIGINMSDNCDEANIIDSTEKEQFKIITFIKDDDVKYNIIIYEITYDMFKFRILKKINGESEFIMDVYVHNNDENKRRDSDSDSKTDN